MKQSHIIAAVQGFINIEQNHIIAVVHKFSADKRALFSKYSGEKTCSRWNIGNGWGVVVGKENKGNGIIKHYNTLLLSISELRIGNIKKAMPICCWTFSMM